MTIPDYMQLASGLIICLAIAFSPEGSSKKKEGVNWVAVALAVFLASYIVEGLFY